jgi:large subunit ribosomal protein L23
MSPAKAKTAKTAKPKKAAGPKAPETVWPKDELYSVLLSPVITEKATQGSEHNQVTFKVALDASKTEIKAAVEGLFGVKVKAVNTLVTQGKKKFFRGMRGQRSDYKKAIITLEAGQTIDVTTGV